MIKNLKIVSIYYKKIIERVCVLRRCKLARCVMRKCDLKIRIVWKQRKVQGRLIGTSLLFPRIRTRRYKDEKFKTERAKCFFPCSFVIKLTEVDESNLMARWKNGCAFIRLSGPQLRKTNTFEDFLNIQVFNLLDYKMRCCWSCFIPNMPATEFC